MIIPIPWLERVPSYKDKREELGLDSYGFLGYPLLQAADILIYKAGWVPVGQDQLPHIELTREVARRFNTLYGPVFPEPQAKLTHFPAVPGIDGRKMSKSYENEISLSLTAEETTKKLKKMFTDPEKLRKGDPGRPEVCPVYTLHKIYNPEHGAIVEPCKSGALGCVDCKMALAATMNDALAPMRERRAVLEQDTALVDRALKTGADRARDRAAATMTEVRKAMHLPG
jgi:tryptophanyl-tRNA synthetase